MRRTTNWRSGLAGALITGSVASLLSAAVLALCGRIEKRSAAAPINAPGHWIYGRKALRRNRPSLRHTAVGFLVHHAASIFWGAVMESIAPAETDPIQRVRNAAALTTLAAVVDLRVVPEHLTPGFERRLSPLSLLLVYLGFGAGIAAGSALAARRLR